MPPSKPKPDTPPPGDIFTEAEEEARRLAERDQELLRDLKAAVIAVVGLALVLVLAIAIFRFVVPLILEAHFPGSLLVAALAGVVGLVVIVLFALFIVRAVRRAAQP